MTGSCPCLDLGIVELTVLNIDGDVRIGQSRDTPDVVDELSHFVYRLFVHAQHNFQWYWWDEVPIKGNWAGALLSLSEVQDAID